MRLKKLKVRNIASLKGEHIVDFQDVMNHSSLFAITGETGSGKSTILNAIGLALYGKIFKRTLIQNDVVTLGEKEGYIELLYEVRGKSYLATWRAKIRKQNGEPYAILPPVERFLYTLLGDQFDSPRTVAQEKSEDVLNLDFDQFSKCVVLNQGEFARFLMSTFTERKDILEKLYPGELLDNLSRELQEQRNFYLTEKNQLDIELKALQTDGQYGVDVDHELKTARRELSLHESWHEWIEKIHYHFTSLHSYHQKFLENKSRITQTKSQLTESTRLYNQLMVNVESSQNAREEFQKEFFLQRPRLEELLKAEEGLKNDKVMFTSLLQEEDKLQAERKSLSEKITKLRIEKNHLLPEIESTRKKMKHPPEIIFRHRNTLEDLIEKSVLMDSLAKSLESEKEKLSMAESSGKQLAKKLEEYQLRLSQISENASLRLKELLKTKETLQAKEARVTELGKQLNSFQEKLKERDHHLNRVREEREPVLATLKVQELLSAISVCVLHPETEKRGSCPVCETPFATGKLQELKNLAGNFNAAKLQDNADRLNREVMKLEEETKLLKKSGDEVQAQLIQLAAEKEKLFPHGFDEKELSEKIEATQKEVWDREQLLPLVKTTSTEIAKARSDYQEMKTRFHKIENDLSDSSDAVRNLTFEIQADIRFEPEHISDLRLDLRLSLLLNELESKVNRLISDLSHHEARTKEMEEKSLEIAHKKNETHSRLSQTEQTLKDELRDQSASVVLKQLNDRQKTLQEIWEKAETERRKQEQEMKLIQGKLYTYDEQSRDIEIQYTKEHKEIREESRKALPELNPSLLQLLETLKNMDLPIASPSGLFLPLKDLLDSEKLTLKTNTNEARSRVAHFSALKDDQEKRKDRIRLIELKRDDVAKELDRRERLYEILGKDELRTYVLSLVEENLIIVTNEELSRLCQGRYEIIHQTKTNKLAPEFFILDKFRDGGIRKVSTLSGGETFMVSLAMALGLAEMTRGTAEIDTLFIDEGFGTLDQDSLDDVFDMLNQIQNRGLMVGIISHVKALTSGLPVNINLQKRPDGTSTISLMVN